MLSTSKRGAISEAYVANKFMEAGFEVFTNHAPDGPADLCVWCPRTGTHAMIDVKSQKPYVRKDGSLSFGFEVANKNPHVWVVLLSLTDHSIWPQDGLYQHLGIDVL